MGAGDGARSEARSTLGWREEWPVGVWGIELAVTAVWLEEPVGWRDRLATPEFGTLVDGRGSLDLIKEASGREICRPTVSEAPRELVIGPT